MQRQKQAQIFRERQGLEDEYNEHMARLQVHLLLKISSRSNTLFSSGLCIATLCKVHVLPAVGFGATRELLG